MLRQDEYLRKADVSWKSRNKKPFGSVKRSFESEVGHYDTPAVYYEVQPVIMKHQSLI